MCSPSLVRIQHALRAFTPDDQKALSKTVRTYPKTQFYDLASDLTSLGIGEAIVTVLSEARRARPGGVDPAAGAAIPDGHHRPRRYQAVAQRRALFLKYGQTVDRESAYEMLAAAGAGAGGRRRSTAAAARGSSCRRMPKPVERPSRACSEQMMDRPGVQGAMRSAARSSGGRSPGASSGRAAGSGSVGADIGHRRR